MYTNGAYSASDHLFPLLKGKTRVCRGRCCGQADLEMILYTSTLLLLIPRFFIGSIFMLLLT